MPRGAKARSMRLGKRLGNNMLYTVYCIVWRGLKYRESHNHSLEMGQVVVSFEVSANDEMDC